MTAPRDPLTAPLIGRWCSGCGAQMHEGEPLHKVYDPGHREYVAPRPPETDPDMDYERRDAMLDVAFGKGPETADAGALDADGLALGEDGAMPDDEAANQWQGQYPNISYAARVAVRLHNRLTVASFRRDATPALDVERLAGAIAMEFPGWLDEAPGTAEAWGELRDYAKGIAAAYANDPDPNDDGVHATHLGPLSEPISLRAAMTPTPEGE